MGQIEDMINKIDELSPLYQQLHAEWDTLRSDLQSLVDIAENADLKQELTSRELLANGIITMADLISDQGNNVRRLLQEILDDNT